MPSNTFSFQRLQNFSTFNLPVIWTDINCKFFLFILLSLSPVKVSPIMTEIIYFATGIGKTLQMYWIFPGAHDHK